MASSWNAADLHSSNNSCKKTAVMNRKSLRPRRQQLAPSVASHAVAPKIVEDGCVAFPEQDYLGYVAPMKFMSSCK